MLTLTINHIRQKLPNNVHPHIHVHTYIKYSLLRNGLMTNLKIDNFYQM